MYAQYHELPDQLHEALIRYIKSRERHALILKGRAGYASNKDWHQMIREEEKVLRESLNEVALLMVSHGYAPRLAQAEDTLANAREVVKLFLNLG